MPAQANRLRRNRELNALRHLLMRGVASARDLGEAAVRGEERAAQIPVRGKESIGLSIGVSLVRRGLARPTATNDFRIALSHGLPVARGKGIGSLPDL
jgi:hypothetical protein